MSVGRVLFSALVLAASVFAAAIGHAPTAGASAAPSSAGSAIVAAARHQLGYQASPYGSECNKFSAYWHNGGDCGNGNRSVAWCADFAAWSWAQAGITGLYGHGIDDNASSFRTWGQAHGRWHPLGDGYLPQPGDVAEYSDDHVGIYDGGPANSPTVINGNWGYPDRGTSQVYEQKDETNNGGGAWLSGYVSPPPPPTPPTWHPMTAMGRGVAAAPAVSSRGAGRLDVFWVGTDGRLYHQSWNGSWSRVSDLGGNLKQTGVAATSWGSSRIDVFAVGNDAKGTLQHKVFDGKAWHAWSTAATGVTSAPAVTSFSSGRLDVFWVGSNDRLRQLTWNHGWSAIGDLGGNLKQTGVAATSWGSSRIDVFALGNDAKGTLQHKVFDGKAWHAWSTAATGVTSAPAVSSFSSGRLDVFWVGSNGRLRQLTWNHSWSAIGDLGGNLKQTGVAATSWGSPRIDVFALGNDAKGTLQHKWFGRG